jgi:hypothetical protein
MIYFLILLSALFGCGTEKTDQKEIENREVEATPVEEVVVEKEVRPLMSFSVDDVDQLPPCEESNNGALAYLQTKFVFHHCRFDKMRGVGGWVVVSIIGVDGNDGKDGVDGKDGQDGTSKITNRLTCTKTLASASSAVVRYTNVLFSSGDVFVSASVSGPQIQASGSEFYSGYQVGAGVGGVAIVYDIWDTATRGFWTFEMNTARLGVTVTFNDSEMTGDGKDSWYISQGGGDCTENKFQ